MPDQDDKISLGNIKGGAAVEMFDLALERVFANIRDINTTLDKREVTLKMIIGPDDDRTFARIAFGVSTKLANQGSQKCTANIKLDSSGRAYAEEREKQLGLGLAFTNVHNMSEGDES